MNSIENILTTFNEVPVKSFKHRVITSNPYLSEIPCDELHHFGLTTKDDLKRLFGSIKFVCTGGSPLRMKMYAENFHKETGVDMSGNLSSTDRFCLYKTGKVLWINHGMGTPSLSIMLIETIKLLHYAGAENVTFIRLGTCGGIGVAPGTVVISTGALNGALEPVHTQYIGGKSINREAIIDKALSEKLFKISQQLDIPAEKGLTWCTDDFYEGQMRIDGAFCEYTKEERKIFFEHLYQIGVRNAEMESTCFAALTFRAGIRNAIVCLAVDRCDDEFDVIDSEHKQEAEMRAFRIVTKLIKEELTMTPFSEGY